MPLYDVECTNCNVRGTIKAPMSESSNLKCPDCGQPVKRIYGATAMTGLEVNRV